MENDAKVSGARSEDPDASSQPDLLPVLLSLARSTRQLMSLKLAEIGVNAGQDQLLLLLGPDQGMAVSKVAGTLGVRPSTVSKMADRLTEKGWLLREASGEDARTTLMRLTHDGWSAKRQVEEVWMTVELELCRSMPASAEKAALVNSLDCAAHMVDGRLKRLR